MLRLLDPNRSLTPKMWAIIGLGFAGWLFWFCFCLARLRNSTHPFDNLPGNMCVSWPYLVFFFGSGAVDKQLQPMPQRKYEWVIAVMFFPLTIAFALFMAEHVRPGAEAMFWFMVLGGLFGIVSWARQLSRRAYAFVRGRAA